MSWIGVGLDGTLARTLARYGGYPDVAIGEPVPEMVRRVKNWLSSGTDVRIVTARVNPEGRPHRDVAWQRDIIESWCLTHIGRRLAVRCSKDYQMIVLYDDRCVHVEKNTGRILG